MFFEIIYRNNLGTLSVRRARNIGIDSEDYLEILDDLPSMPESAKLISAAKIESIRIKETIL